MLIIFLKILVNFIMIIILFYLVFNIFNIRHKIIDVHLNVITQEGHLVLFYKLISNCKNIYLYYCYDSLLQLAQYKPMRYLDQALKYVKNISKLINIFQVHKNNRPYPTLLLLANFYYKSKLSYNILKLYHIFLT